MKKFDFKDYNRGTIKIEIQSLGPEKFINLLWKNNVYIKNITKVTITTMIMEIKLRDYRAIEAIAKKTGTKVRIVERKGMSFFIIRMKRNTTLVCGAGLFVIILYYLSTFIWGIDIITDKYISPFEVRQILASYGIKPGVPKKKIDVYEVEEKMKKIDDIMWSRIRVEGSRLKVTLVESISPPEMKMPEENEACNVVAKADGEIVTIFTTAGTALVKPGAIVKSGQLLIKGEQGKDGSTYAVHAKGEVIAKTWYEEIREIPIRGAKTERTGKKSENIYINILGKKIYMKKTLTKFEQCDKIEDNNSFIKKETFYETVSKAFELDKERVQIETVEAMKNSVMNKLDKSVKLVDKTVDIKQNGDNLRITAVFTVQQDIALPQKIQ